MEPSFVMLTDAAPADEPLLRRGNQRGGLVQQAHGWVHKLFSNSIIADLLRYSQVPVLLLLVVPD